VIPSFDEIYIVLGGWIHVKNYDPILGFTGEVSSDKL
jgi:hypothetical protein